MPEQTLEEELRALLNRRSEENASHTPDFILAQFLMGCLESFNRAIWRREQWYGRSNLGPGQSSGAVTTVAEGKPIRIPSDDNPVALLPRP